MSLLLKELASRKDILSYISKINETIEGFKPYSEVVMPEDKSKYRTMAEGREGLVRLVGNIALQHAQSLSRSDDPTQLQTRLEYNDVLEQFRQSLKQITEYVEGTQHINTADIMYLADRYMGALDLERNSNAAVNEAMKQVDDWHSRYGKRPNLTTSPTITTETNNS